MFYSFSHSVSAVSVNYATYDDVGTLTSTPYQRTVNQALDFSGFFDTCNFTVGSANRVDTNVVNINLSNFLDFDTLSASVYGGSDGSGDNLGNAMGYSATLADGDYSVVVSGIVSGIYGGSYEIIIAAVPIPTAVLLFGSAEPVNENETLSGLI